MIVNIEELQTEYVYNVANQWIKEGLTLGNARRQLSYLLLQRQYGNANEIDNTSIQILERVINQLAVPE
jgi:hypothetical protein